MVSRSKFKINDKYEREPNRGVGIVSHGAPQGELIYLANNPSAAERMRMSRLKKAGEAIQLGQNLYVVGTTMKVKDVVRHHCDTIISLYWPGGVVVGKSALSSSLRDGGEVFISSPNPKRVNPLTLEGVTIIPILGPGSLPGDIPLPNGVFISGDARRLIENVHLIGKPAKWRAGKEKVEDAVDSYIRTGGPAKIHKILNEIDVIESHFDSKAVLFVKQTLIAVLGTVSRGAPTPQSARLAARLSSTPIDASRIETLKHLVHLLHTKAPIRRPALSPASQREWLPFFEAYFSNFIEGTEFEIDEAFKIALQGFVSPARPADSHDISASYRLTSDSTDCSRVPTRGAELLEILRDRHGKMMAARPEVTPGVFKTIPNQVGSYRFVEPYLVEGTLLAGFEVMEQLANPLARAVAMTALITECHPFVDGNGRISRLMANSELSARGEVRIVIPTISRDNYLVSLRAYSDPAVGGDALFDVLDHAQKWSEAVDWTDYENAKIALESYHAFETSLIADRKKLRLGFPGRT